MWTDAISDNVVIAMYFKLPHGDMSFTVLEVADGKAALDVHVPADMFDSVAKKIRSWWHGIKPVVSPVFAGRTVPMVGIKADLPIEQIGTVVGNLVQLAGAAMQKGGGEEASGG